METTELLKQKVGELVAKDYRLSTVFKKFNIDFCCGGGKMIEEICKAKQIDPEVLIKEISKIEKQVKTQHHDYDKWDLAYLCDYIVNVHHKYVEENVPILLEFSNKVAKVHGSSNPEVIRINELVKSSVNELITHMKKEELILFPYIKNLEHDVKHGQDKPISPFGTIENPINMMLYEHDLVGKWFKEIEEISNKFTPPEHACNTYRVLYCKLKEFYDDLITHIHLENNILFTKSIELEKSK